MSLKQFADTLPDYAKDIRLNLGSILSDQLLGNDRKLGTRSPRSIDKRVDLRGGGYRADRELVR